MWSPKCNVKPELSKLSNWGVHLETAHHLAGTMYQTLVNQLGDLRLGLCLRRFMSRAQEMWRIPRFSRKLRARILK
jgi:hypothetical protein